MSSTVVGSDVTFAYAPFADGKTRIVLPAHFDPAMPFVVCVFLHGRTLDEAPFEDHIAAAAGQMDATAVNAMLVAPRFDDAAEPGGFAHPTGFSRFIAELRSVLPPLLERLSVAHSDAARTATYAATQAPLAIVAFSGGFKPLNSIVTGLLSPSGRTLGCADRVAGIELLDSIYGDTSASGAVLWQKKKRTQSALLSIYGRDTGDNAKAANITLMAKLNAHGPVTVLPSAVPPTAAPAGSVTFLEVVTPHLSLLSDGPPEKPIATFLDLLADRLPGHPMA